MNKIEALTQTIYNLENDVYEYSWFYFDKCNCGILARTILDGKKPNLSDATFGWGFGGMAINTFAECKQTGKPLPEVFQALYNCGFTGEELDNLEKCGSCKDDVIIYMRKWAYRLEKEEEIVSPPIPEVKEKIRYIKVPDSLTEQTRVEILKAELVS